MPLRDRVVPSDSKCRKELCDTHHLDAVILHVSDEIQIALQVVIAGNKILGPARNRDLQEHIVIRITAQLHCADDRHDGRARGDEAKVLNDVFLANPVLPPYAGTPKDVTDLFEDGQRDHDVERTIEPRLYEAGGSTLCVEKGRNPNVRVKQNGGLHGAWLSLPHAPP